jgi:hypothetical protein
LVVVVVVVAGTLSVGVIIVVVGLSVEVVVVVVGKSPPDLDEMQGGVVEAVMKWQMVMMNRSRTQVTWENCVVMMVRQRWTAEAQNVSQIMV